MKPHYDNRVLLRGKPIHNCLYNFKIQTQQEEYAYVTAPKIQDKFLTATKELPCKQLQEIAYANKLPVKWDKR